MSAEFRGRWVLRGGIRVPIPNPEPEPEPKPKPKPKLGRGPVEELATNINWTPETLRQAHAAYVAGKRDIYTVAGHREWDRRYRRKRRRLSTVDVAWCERQVVRDSWLVWEKTNRTTML